MTASQHPVDVLIRELIASRRVATEEENATIVGRMAVAPFSLQRVRVPLEYRGMEYLGRRLGSREPSFFLHLVQRVVEDKQ